MNIVQRKKSEFQKVCKAFIGLKSEKEAFALLRDICTLSELSAMAERLDVAEQVQQ